MEELNIPVFLIIVSLILILLTIIPILNKKKWWIRIFDFPRLQIFTLLVLSLGYELFYLEQFEVLDFIIVGLVTLALFIQGFYIFPYLTVAKKEVQKSSYHEVNEHFSLMVSNVFMKNKKSSKLLQLVEKNNPDILLVLETNSRWEKALSPLEIKYKHTIKYPLENTYGMILFSNIDIQDSKISFLINDDVPSIHANLVLKKSNFKISCLHPRPPAPDEAKTSKLRDKELLLVANKVENNSSPCIVLGDLNDVAWSDTTKEFQRTSKLLDPRKGRGFFNTFNANIPILRWALDHIFFSKEFKLLKMKRLPHIGSDHFPILIELGI